MKSHMARAHGFALLVAALLGACDNGAATNGVAGPEKADKLPSAATPAVAANIGASMSGMTAAHTLTASDAATDVQQLASTTQPVRWYYIVEPSTQRWYIVAPSNQSVLMLDRVDETTSFGIYWKPVNNYAAASSPGTQAYPDAGLNFSTVTVAPDGRTVSFGGARSDDASVRSLANTSQPVLWYYIANSLTNRWYIVSPTGGSVLLLDRVDKTTSFGIYWRPINNWVAKTAASTSNYADAGDNFTSVSLASNGGAVLFGALRTTQPQLSLTASPQTLTAGQATTLNWSATNASSCSAPWTPSTSTTGNILVAPATTTTYSMSCSGLGGTATNSVTVTVSATGALALTIAGLPSGVAGNVTLTGPNNLKGEASFSTTLTGIAPGAYTIFAASVIAAGVTYSPTPASQQQTVVPNGTASAIIMYSAGAASAPSVTVTVSSSTLTAGQEVTVSWTSNNATACTGSWSGSSIVMNGSKVFLPTSTTIYAVTCTGAGGVMSDAKTVTVNVVSPAPTAAISASPASISLGQASSLTWSSTNATACAGSWTSGMLPISGIQVVRPSVTTTYSVTCVGAGSATASAVVTVSGTPEFKLTAFPLAGRTPYTAVINSVFDHSMSAPYTANGVVVAYTGETGRTEYGQDYVITLNGIPLYGFKGSAGTAFSVNGHYAGGGNSQFLYYDGHPGIDYRTTDQSSDGIVNVYAAATGTVHLESNDKYHTLYIDHVNGYRTYYLHLSQWLVADGVTVQAGQLIAKSGSAGVAAPHLHFEVRLNGVPVDPYGWTGSNADPYTLATNRVLW